MKNYFTNKTSNTLKKKMLIQPFFVDQRLKTKKVIKGMGNNYSWSQNTISKGIEADLKKGRSQDFSEQTTESENDEVLDEIHHEAKIELSLVNQAIQRIEQNKYGSCSQCEEPINPERLTALPYTNTCINCAQ